MKVLNELEYPFTGKKTWIPERLSNLPRVMAPSKWWVSIWTCVELELLKFCSLLDKFKAGVLVLVVGVFVLALK